jgi:hypothetical protein
VVLVVFSGTSTRVSGVHPRRRRKGSWQGRRADADESQESPTLPQEPGTRAGCRRGLCRRECAFAPPLEPRRGGHRIGAHARGPCSVLACVTQHVAQSDPHLRRRAQDAVVVAVSENAADTSPQSIQGASHADRQALESARKGRSRVALHDQVQVIRLHAEVDEPKPFALTTRDDRTAQRLKFTQPSQRRQSRVHSHGHCDRKAVLESRASVVRDVRALAAPLGSRSLASSTPAVREHEPLLRGFRAPSSPCTNRSRLLGHCNAPSLRRASFLGVALERAHFRRK